ncbi:MAG: thioredoxin domain-containing protein, partial [Rhodospirillales bacterium]|nr:thioredoxin domain-containing protein [Rhodospirillales bacterium]
MQNRLKDSSSPYLLQHRDNPVHWHMWGEDAFAEAKARNVPVLLSIGYAACHWCHVMAHESFENDDVAALMNERFVSIKVDREERPDIDQTYMTALHAMGQQGGWPLTMVLTPEGAPFWGGTYFPPKPGFGRPSFSQVLVALSDAWKDEQGRIGRSIATIQNALAKAAAARPGDPPGPELLEAARAAFLRSVDWEKGGFSGAPKFPNIPVFKFLWHEYFRVGDAQCAVALHLLLERMSQGGIYDHLGGGYARYATDDAWLVPHFEKMLYDNALILEMLAFAQADRPNPLYEARARETVEWLTRDMSAEGAFAAAEDADSEGEEGKFYVWTRAEIESVLGEDTAFFEHFYPLPVHGNWEEKIILERRAPFGP